MNITPSITSLPLDGKTVLLRADLNVPISNGTILNDYRLLALLPTLEWLRARNATIVLATHIGRPTDHEPDLSTKHLLPWFQHRDYSILFAPNLSTISMLIKDHPGSIILLENMRFYPGEQTHDQHFAQQLADCAEFYINDAFALLHRDDTSITLVPRLFSPEKRALGFLIQDELAHLNKLLNNPARPFSLILGGGKIDTKIPLLKNLLPYIDNLFLCPAIVFSFLKALNKPTGKSLVDDATLATCADLLTQARSNGVAVHFPIDYQIAHEKFDGNLTYVDADQLPDSGVGVSIGPKTIALFSPIIERSQTIFYNGLMGTLSRKETLGGMNGILNAMAHSKGFSVIGGGDSVGAAELLGYAQRISYLSTGGGATLTYLSGAPLPGLEPFIN